MTTETLIFSTLQALVSGRVYPDVAPLGTATPFITYQQAGGTPVNFMDAATLPSLANARMQINVWATTRPSAVLLARHVEQALRSTPALQTTVLSQHEVGFEPATRLYGTRQDFSFWTP